MNNNKNYTRILLNIAIPAFLLMTLLLIFQWCSINNNINEMKKQNQNNFETIDTLKNYGPLQIKYNQFNKRQIIINSEEFERANTYIRALTDEVQKQSDKTESIIDRDLNRLNLYMAVGIGFMTLLGIFAPLLTNVLTVQDLRDKQKEIDKEFEGIKGDFDKLKKTESNIKKAISDSKSAIDNANKALEKSNKLDKFSEKVDAIEFKTQNITLGLCNIVLQNAIARFFNISSVVLTNAVREKDYQSFINLLEAIKNAFQGCKDDTNHVILENNQFSNTVQDFILFLETEKFRYQSVFSTKKEVKEFDNLIRHLETLKDSNNDNESKNYKALNAQINVIINIFKDKHAKNQQATQAN